MRSVSQGFLADVDLSANAIEQARQRAAAGAGYIDLTSSNPTQQGWLFPPDVLREAAEPFWAQRRYAPDPRGRLEARQAIAAYYQRRTPALVMPVDDIFITASTSEAYSLLFALLTEPGDNVLAPDVSYPLFDYLAAIHHVELQPYHLDPQRGWQVDGDSLRDAVDARTRAVLLISPHNPTGAVITVAVPALDDVGLPVICDEVFAEFTYGVPHVPPLGALHPALPVFHLNGISKLFALPDLKLGWMALSGAASARYGERLEVLNDMFLGANSLTQFMLPQLFARGWGFVEALRTHVRHNFDLALRLLAAHPRIHARPPAGGYNLLCEVRGEPDEEALVLRLLARGVLVHPGYFFNCVPEDAEHAYVMISCLTESDTLQRGLQHLLRALAEG